MSGDNRLCSSAYCRQPWAGCGAFLRGDGGSRAREIVIMSAPSSEIINISDRGARAIIAPSSWALSVKEAAARPASERQWYKSRRFLKWEYGGKLWRRRRDRPFWPKKAFKRLGAVMSLIKCCREIIC